MAVFRSSTILANNILPVNEGVIPKGKLSVRMRYRKLDKWDAPETSVNLLFFAQLLDELFFDFSLDTYKPSAMNSSLLCEEALEVIEEIEKGNIKRPNLQHVLDELCENLERDPVTKELLSISLKQINSVLKTPKEPDTEKKVIVELILRQIYLKKYKKKNEELLKQVIKSDKTDFRSIRTLTRSYATTLVNLGYSFEYISEVTQKFFHYDKNRIAGNAAVDDFLDIFSGKPHEFTIIFKFSDTVKHYKKSFDSFKIELLDDLSGIKANLSKYNFNKNLDQTYACLKEIKARDVVSAKNKAEELLEILSTIFSLFHHKEQINWLSDCLIINHTDNTVERSRNKTNAMHKCEDQKLVRASKNANDFLSEFGLESNSFNVFTRSAELHALALNSDSKENQMLNLWIALESIIPASHDEKISNIEHIINSVTPFLNLMYYQRLVSRFTSDLYNWNRKETRNILKGISGENSTVKVAKLLALKSYEPQRKTLVAAFKDFHLLLDRFNYLCYVYSSPKNMLDGLTSHKLRVAWQIRRIYRSRNLIVHSGNTPSYTEMLIENIHDYLDAVMNRIIQLGSKTGKIISIEQAFKYTTIMNSMMIQTLSVKGATFDDESIEKLFGEI